MKPECEAAVRAAAGSRKLSDADIRAIEKRLQSSSKAVRRADPLAWQGMDPVERLQAAAKHARETHLEQIANGHASALRRLQVKLRNDALIDALPAGKQLAGLEVNTFLQHGKSAQNPVEARINALRQWIGGRITGADERFLSDPTKADALAQEAAGEDSGDATAKAVTKRWQAVQDELLARLQRAGVHISDLENWRSPQPWEWTRIPDRDTWVQDMLGWIDPKEFTTAEGVQQSPEQLRHTLEEAWLTLKTNGANKRAESPRGRRGANNVGARYGATRQLHFKDGASWLAAMRKYGQSDDIGGILRAHWRNMARDVAIAETHGPMADTDFRERVARAEANDVAAAKTEKQARKAAAKAKWILDQWDVLTRGQSPGNAHVAAFMGAVRSLMSASKLGVLYSQQPSDALMAMNYLKLIGMKTAHFARDVAAGLNASGERAAWMRAAGAWSDSAHDMTTRFGDTEVWNNMSKFLNKTVYVRSGMRALDRANTAGIAGSFYGTLGEHLASSKDFDALPDASREFLVKHGMTPELWGVLRKVALSRLPDGDGRVVLNPADIYNIPDEALRTLAEKRVAGTNDELKARIAQLNAATEKEAGWTAARQQKLDDLRQRVTTAIKALEAKESVRSGHAAGVAAARAELLRAQVARAELEASNAHYLDVRDQINRTSDAMDRALDDDKLASQLQKFAHMLGTNGEKIGALRAAAEARIKAAEKALADKEAAASDKLDEKQNAADKLVAKHAKDLAAFTREMQNRAARREDLLAAYRKQVGKQVVDETARIKDEVTGNILGAFDDVLHAAGRGYAKSSVTERGRLGLNKFEAGTLPGEVARMFYMIRQVPFGLAMTHLLDVPRGLDGWAPRSQYILKYMLGQAIATGIALQLRHIVAGEDPEDMASWKFAGKVAAGAGIGPLMAAILFGSGGEHNDPMGKILGPGGEALDTGLTLAQQVRDDIGSDKDVDWGRIGNRTVSFARSNAVPFMNFWYTKAAFNHLIYQQLQEAVSPGYNERVQQRLRQREVSQYWQNGRAIPQRAPDLKRMTGQSAP